MSNKEILDLMIMGKKISIACPPKDKDGLIKAAEILNEQIESIPDKSNALILASLDLAFKNATENSGEVLDSKLNSSIGIAVQEIEKSLKG
jgi:cell division protein ZapA (FtsZ GTPase activity inhibitor)